MKKIYIALITLATLIMAIGAVVQVNIPGNFIIGTPPPTQGLQASITSLNFGQINPGSITIVPFTLTNTGNVNLILNYTCFSGTTPCGPISSLVGTEAFSVILRTAPGAELINYNLVIGATVSVEALLSVSPTIVPGSYSFTITVLTN